MNKLPGRIKDIKKEYLPKLQKFTNWFIIFWLFNLAGSSHLQHLIGKNELSENLTLLVGLIAVVSLSMMILALVFLCRIVGVLYIDRYKNGTILGFVLSWILPFGGLISFIIFLQVTLDSRKVLRGFKYKITNSYTSELVKKIKEQKDQ